MNYNMNHVGLLTKQQNIDYSRSTRPTSGTPGGGMAVKTLYTQEAIPEMTITSDFDIDIPVLLIDPLIMHEGDVMNNMEKLKSTKGIKILWAEEQELFRWTSALQKLMLGIVDGVSVCNEYLKQQFTPLIGHEPQILYTPISDNHFDTTKQNRAIAAGQISLRKNTHGLMDTFKSLPETIETMYVGNSGLWGGVLIEADKALEMDVSDTVGKWVPSATMNEVAKFMAESMFYVNMSVYDVGCLSFLEAATAKCVCFAWDYHPMFDEYKTVIRFFNTTEMLNKLDNVQKSGIAEGVGGAQYDEITAKHSYPAFRRQLKEVIDNVMYA